jgi:hypothetical protein
MTAPFSIVSHSTATTDDNKLTEWLRTETPAEVEPAILFESGQ